MQFAYHTCERTRINISGEYACLKQLGIQINIFASRSYNLIMIHRFLLTTHITKHAIIRATESLIWCPTAIA